MRNSHKIAHMKQQPITAILASNIKIKRAELKLSELMNVSRLSIGLIETQKRWVSPEMLEKLATALKCEEKDLFIRNDV